MEHSNDPYRVRTRHDHQGAKDFLINWIRASDGDSRRRQFQVLDSLVSNWVYTGIIEDPTRFAFAEELADFARSLSTFMQGTPTATLIPELRSFEPFRPVLPRLAIIPVGVVPYAVDHGSGAPDRAASTPLASERQSQVVLPHVDGTDENQMDMSPRPSNTSPPSSSVMPQYQQHFVPLANHIQRRPVQHPSYESPYTTFAPMRFESVYGNPSASQFVSQEPAAGAHLPLHAVYSAQRIDCQRQVNHTAQAQAVFLQGNLSTPARQHLSAGVVSNLPTFSQLKQRKESRYLGLVATYDHALALEVEYKATNNRLVEACEDFPSDIQDQREQVRRLYEAIIDHNDLLDRQVVPKGCGEKRKRDEETDGAEDEGMPMPTDNTQVRRVKTAPNVVLEIMCWRLLYAIKDAQEGEIQISDWTGKNPPYDKCGSFTERMALVVDSLRRSKAITDDVMAPDFLRRLVAAPKTELRRKELNKSNNALKKQQIAAGVNAMRTPGSTTNSSALSANNLTQGGVTQGNLAEGNHQGNA